MKVALINPPRSPYNGILEHARPEAEKYIHKKLIGPPLGLLTLAANITDFDLCFLEMKGEYDLHPSSPPPAEMVRGFLGRERPDIVAVTFIASEFPLGMEIFRVAKEFNPEIVTVAGGLHANLCSEDFAGPLVDIVCPGPGARVFRSIVEAVEKRQGFDHISGILVQGEQGLRSTGQPFIGEDPAGKDFIMPDRSLVKRWLSTYVVGRAKGPSTYLFTSLGCPYSCSFCSIWPQYEGKYLQRSVDSVIEELKTLDEYEVVRFCDANTLVNLDFARLLFDRIEREGIRKTFIMDIRADTAANNPRLIEKLAGGGLKVVITGFESIRQEELKKYNKQLQAGQAAEAIRIFHDNGIMLRGNYIVPTSYTDEDFTVLAEYSASHPVNFAGYTILTPFPGTQLFHEERASIVETDLARFNMFNAVTKTTLPPAEFYRRVSDLWLIRRGTDVLS